MAALWPMIQPYWTNPVSSPTSRASASSASPRAARKSSTIWSRVASIRQAWDAALDGRSLEQAASVHAELRQAIETYGGV
ncbi:MAG: hypothetical protein EHM91_17035 [Planctomycetota bacterium]|nr:MAG: hypothetical protein EHM91_17035 [Planctomycetota bacterium]